MSQITVTLPDNSARSYGSGVTPQEIAESIGSHLAQDALAAQVDGQSVDLNVPIEADAEVAILTGDSPEGHEVLLHSTAHLMAHAVKKLFPDAKVTIGPAIENRFYYDFDVDVSFSDEVLAKIELKMKELAKSGQDIVRQEMSVGVAVKMFAEMGEPYKVEIIGEIDPDEVISAYTQNDFTDLCRGPHVPATSYIKHFKLMKLAGAYWRGDSDNEMLQRIYGTAWESEESLNNYLTFLEEAEKRDHRKLGREMDLFHIQEEAVGSIFWHKKGWVIFREIEKYIRSKLEKAHYEEVKTPQMIDKTLWEKSGHWEKFRDHMFTATSEERTLAIKPMNCPGHIEIFKTSLKSYRQLPLRMAEFGCCHRNESSGSLHGIMRVRSFTQDDAHIFCTEEQINSETINFCKLLKEVYEDFGFSDVQVKFSTRPEVRAGTDETWDKSEKALEEAIKQAGLDYEVQEGEGAFYGPKLEFTLVDAIGREWQCGTLQVDFILPERLDANYITSDGTKKRPVMLHRAILGSFERFIGILIENYAGKFPLWLAPTQMVVATITNDSDEYAKTIIQQLEDCGFRVEADLDAQKINYKIREHSMKKVPYILAIGKQEAENKTISVRKFGQQDQEVLELSDFIDRMKKEIFDKK